MATNNNNNDNNSHDVKSIYRQDLFLDQVAIVTGGGSGIGFAISKELLSLGAIVIICSRKKDRIDAAVQQLTQLIQETPFRFPSSRHTGSRIYGQVCNIRDEDSVSKLMEWTISNLKAINLLVNNAGGQFPSPAAGISAKGWKAVIETNLTGTFYCCKQAYTHYMQENGGSIVTITADMWKGFPGMSHTGAARAGVVNLTKTLAIEWAVNGVRVNSVAPGVIYSDTAAANYEIPDFLVEHRKHIPAMRLGTVEEVSSLVCWILSPAANYMTGETVRMDGGTSIYRSMWEIPDHGNTPWYGYLPPKAHL